MSNLAALNDLRKEAKTIGMTGYGRMKYADLLAAVTAQKKADALAALADQEKADLEASVRNEKEIDRLRAQRAASTDPAVRESVGFALARMGASIVPQGSEAHEQYRANLSAALADPNAFAFLDAPQAEDETSELATAFRAPSTDAEQAFAEAVDADDHEAMSRIVHEAAPMVLVRPVRDPNAIRYEDIPMWTDDRLDTKEAELAARLTRRTLLGGDRRLTESRLARIRSEIESRSN